MAVSRGPSITPDTTPRRALAPTFNRSFTLPPKLASANRGAEIGAKDGVETLFLHSNASVIKFSTTSARPGSSSSSYSRPQSSSGTLPWKSTAEQTVAVGQLELYSVPGSANFLHAGTLLHPLLKRSECWCVDGMRKFVLRAREPDTYYRVELPADEDVDLEKIEELKFTLSKMLFYEKTPCPFQRTFTVDLPEDRNEPVRKKRKSSGPAKRWRLDRGHSWRPDGWAPPSEDESGSESASEEETSAGPKSNLEADELADVVNDLNLSPTAVRPSGQRSVSAPLQPTIHTSSQLRTKADLGKSVIDATAKGATDNGYEEMSNSAALRTFQAIPMDMPPSPPDSSGGLEAESVRREIGHREDEGVLSDGTVSGHSLEQLRSINDGDTPAVAETQQVVEPTCTPSPPHFMEHILETQTSTASEATLRDSSRDEQAWISSANQSQVIKDTLPETSSKDNNYTEGAAMKHESSTEASLAAATSLRSTPELLARTLDSVTNKTNHSPFKEASAARPSTPAAQTGVPAPAASPDVEDPYAAIQARILARRSIGSNPGTPRTTTSSGDSREIATNRRSNRQNQQHLTSALVQKAYALFLGPPAHLVAAMLRIAAMIANGTFALGSLVGDMDGVPESYRGGDRGWHESWEDGEDDFGVPLRSPHVRLEGLRNRAKDDKGLDDD